MNNSRCLNALSFAILASIFLGHTPALFAQADANPPYVQVVGDDLQATLDAAPAHAVVLCDRANCITISETVIIRKPVTLKGLNAQLSEGLGKTPILLVKAENVTLEDFELYGNVDSVTQENRAPLVIIAANDFRVENGQVFNSTKDGIMISGSDKGGDVTGGVVRNIVGRRIVRDVVSIGGSDTEGYRIRNVLVENIRSYDSELRGPVEVSDGSDNITVRKIYAESCHYAVDIQDHNKPTQINTNIVIEDVFAIDCDTAIRTANRDFGHANLTLRDITAVNPREGSNWSPIHIRHTANLVIENIRVFGCPDRPGIVLENCDGVKLRDVTIEGLASDTAAVLAEDCNDVLIDGVTLRGDIENSSNVVLFRVDSDEIFTNLRIHNVVAPDVPNAGIALERAARGGTLNGYIISDNLATVSDEIKGKRARITGNL